MSNSVNHAKAAIARRSQKKNSTGTGHYIAIGGAFAAVVGAIVLLVLHPARGPFETPVNDSQLIEQFSGGRRSTWTAAPVSTFEEWTIGDVKTLLGVSVSSSTGSLRNCVVGDVQELPKNFDSRVQWPSCFGYANTFMGNCTASWALAAASTMANRMCIADPSTYPDLRLSAQELLSCDEEQRGCKGGDLDTMWNYIERNGLVTEACFPYQADDDTKCTTKCTSETPLRGSGHCVLSGEAAIMREVYANGPVVAPIFLNDEILVYKGGVYVESPTTKQFLDMRRQKLLHAIIVIGWGTDESSGLDYWLVENFFGPDWGEGGAGKLFRAPARNGGDQGATDMAEGMIIIDSFVMAGKPENAQAPLPSTYADDADVDHEYEELDIEHTEPQAGDVADVADLDHLDVEDDRD